MNKILTFHNDCRLNDRCAKYETCPMILVHKILSGKWKILILWYLSNDTLRFSELKLEARPGEVNVTVIVGAGNIGHLESRRTVTY